MSDSLGAFQTVQLPQGVLEYREAGSGRPIVFVHGVQVNGDLWRRVVPHLADSFRCIAPDLPLGGHRVSFPAHADLTPTGIAAIVAAFLDALDLHDVVLVGSDTGGAISQLVAAYYPSRVGALVLTNCDAFDTFPPPLVMPFKWGAFVPGLDAVLAKLLQHLPASGRLLYALLAKHDPGQAVLNSYFQPYRSDPAVRRDAAKVIRAVHPRYTNAAAKTFPAFDKPVTIVWGTDDPVFSKRDAKRLAETFPNARLEWVVDSRAFVAEDQPERLAEAIRHTVREPAERLSR